MRRWATQDPFWLIVLASYRPAELDAYIRLADTLEALERDREAHGWSRRVD